MAGAGLLVLIGALAIGPPLVVFLAVWWSVNCEGVRIAESVPVANEAGERAS